MIWRLSPSELYIMYTKHTEHSQPNWNNHTKSGDVPSVGLASKFYKGVRSFFSFISLQGYGEDFKLCTSYFVANAQPQFREDTNIIHRHDNICFWLALRSSTKPYAETFFSPWNEQWWMFRITYVKSCSSIAVSVLCEILGSALSQNDIIWGSIDVPVKSFITNVVGKICLFFFFFTNLRD